ncbi:sucrose cleavage family protein [Aulographum hederae CBS 113979]|uniref:Altered inheritance of mitochondria protein 32 n=1 Tax=Aulographum hederae CBS 113979 TaxID=1176131 RepID=A0A6G1HAW8_9PEZI|nr:sucrose cleavage family protein [Aulographum hederae CBS 113979]
MSLPWLRLPRASLRPSSYAFQTRHASRLRVPIPPPFPIVESCPPATCSCRPMPSGLDIDRERPLNGTMAAYAEQVLLCTGKDDWSSKIEEDEDAVFARELKGLLGRDGKLSNPYHNVLVTNCSFPSLGQDIRTEITALVLPSFRSVSFIPSSKDGAEVFLKAFILPTKLHDAHNVLSEEQRQKLLRVPELQSEFATSTEIKDVVVLICGHGGRDDRCGIMGPLLRNEFEEKLEAVGFESGAESARSTGTRSARVGLISHIGGHKYAGNVIIYIPASMKGHPLAGKGVWYGRVGPEHVEGLVKETIMEGKVVKDMFRGGISQGGDLMRL